MKPQILVPGHRMETNVSFSVLSSVIMQQSMVSPMQEQTMSYFQMQTSIQ